MKDEPECEPDDLDEGDDAHAEDQTQKSPNVGKEVDPSHADLESSLALSGYSYSPRRYGVMDKVADCVTGDPGSILATPIGFFSGI